ncbi:MAG: hypothetical protein M3Q30_12320 [Actinomycetota bacterium]|nr:hypothetical protein [Actinomycetota bacterium]
MASVDHGRGERSLWPLAAIPLAGALLIGGTIFAASHIWRAEPADQPREQPRESRLLDSLTVDARLVTPPGTREVRLTRTHVCPRGEGDSSATQVGRELRLDADVTPQAAREAMMSQFVRKGWVREPQNPLATVNKGSRSVSISDNTTGHVLTVSVAYGGDGC